MTCTKCATVDAGTYCSNCGALLPGTNERTFVAFADGFLKVQERWRYLRTYGRILRSPTDNTLALYDEGDAPGAFAFLQISILLYTLLVISKVFDGGPLVSELAVPVILLLSMSLFLAIFYRLAQRRSSSGRSSRDFLVLSAYTTGFTLPFAAALELLPSMMSGALPIAMTLLLVVALYVYLLRIWSRFWELRKRTVLGYLIVASLTSNVTAWIVGFAIGLIIATA